MLLYTNSRSQSHTRLEKVNVNVLFYFLFWPAKCVSLYKLEFVYKTPLQECL